MKHFKQCVATCLALLPTYAWADVICLTSGQEIKSKVVTVGEKEITYKKAENLNGPNYVVANESVFYIEFDDGHREVITPQDVPQTSTSPVYHNAASPASETDTDTGRGTLAGTVVKATNGMKIEPKKKHNRFPSIGFMPRAVIGYQATQSEYKSVNYDWGGLYADIDLMALMSMGENTAWSAGLGFTWMQGDMKVYTGKKPSKKDWPALNATYIGIPIMYWWKSEYLMLGTGFNLDFLVQCKLGGQKAKDALNGFRVPWKIYAGCSLGLFDIGLHLGFDLTSAFKGKDMSWSPTISVGGSIGVRLGK